MDAQVMWKIVRPISAIYGTIGSKWRVLGALSPESGYYVQTFPTKVAITIYQHANFLACYSDCLLTFKALLVAVISYNKTSLIWFY